MTYRRTLLALTVGLILPIVHALTAQQFAGRNTYVIVHGAWGGAYGWRAVSDLLTANGHVVFRPTLTGLGERAHLSSPEIGLETHITDVMNVILYENLQDVTLVGHSYGGMVVTAVADRLPDRIAHLAYIDAFLPENGENLITLRKATGRQLPGEIRGAFVVPTWVKPGTPTPTNVPQPLKTFTDPILLKNPSRERIPTTYVLTMDPGAVNDEFDMFATRAKEKKWLVRRLTADHNPQRSAPKELSALLEQVR